MKDEIPTLVITTFAALPIGTAFRQQHAGGRSHARYRKVSATEAQILTKYPDTDPVVPVPPDRRVVIATIVKADDRSSAIAGTLDGAPKTAAAPFALTSRLRDEPGTPDLTSEQLAASRAYWREAFARIPNDGVDDEGAGAASERRRLRTGD